MHLALPEQAAPCLQPPAGSGWQRLQAWAVDGIKRRALRRLHRSVRGEILLLQVYLAGEEATERSLQQELLTTAPAWLAQQAARHLAEEEAHARAFATQIEARGGQPGQFTEPDWLSRRKIARWRRIAQAHAPGFAQGLLVPAYAIGLCAEQMAERVLARHCDTIGPAHPMHALLARVLADERRHVRLCAHTLQRIVAPAEQSQLQALLAEVRAVDRSWGIASALGMLLAGWWFGRR